MWSYFSHPNLLPFYGIYQVIERLGCVGLVSPWMENGNVNEYLQANPGAPRLPLVRIFSYKCQSAIRRPTINRFVISSQASNIYTCDLLFMVT